MSKYSKIKRVANSICHNGSYGQTYYNKKTNSILVIMSETDNAESGASSAIDVINSFTEIGINKIKIENGSFLPKEKDWRLVSNGIYILCRVFPLTENMKPVKGMMVKASYADSFSLKYNCHRYILLKRNRKYSELTNKEVWKAENVEYNSLKAHVVVEF